jgi:hypothetical protein
MKAKHLKRHLDSYDDDEELAYMIWSREDVQDAAKRRGLELTNNQADEVLEFVDHHKDCELGISWTTIDCALDEPGSYTK